MVWEDEFEQRPARSTIKVALRVIGVVLAIAAVIFVIRVVVYPVGQAQQVVERTLDADNAIYNYEYFKQAWQDVQATDKKIVTAQQTLDQFVKDAGPRSEWDFRDKEEHGRLQTNVVGLQNVRAEMVATYNARAKMANRSIFMSKELPEHID